MTTPHEPSFYPDPTAHSGAGLRFWDGRTWTDATAPGPEAPVISPDGGSYWDGSSWNALPPVARQTGGPQPRWWWSTAAGLAAAALIVAVPAVLVLSGTGQPAAPAQAGAQRVAPASGSASVPTEDQQSPAGAGTGPATAAPAAASPTVPVAERAEAGALCLEETEDRLVRRCPDGSLYEIPAVEADLAGEGIAGSGGYFTNQAMRTMSGHAPEAQLHLDFYDDHGALRGACDITWDIVNQLAEPGVQITQAAIDAETEPGGAGRFQMEYLTDSDPEAVSTALMCMEGFVGRTTG